MAAAPFRHPVGSGPMQVLVEASLTNDRVPSSGASI